MELDIYQIDAFAEQIFEGNPAAVVPLNEWLPNDVLQSIAEENNLSETAFFVKEESRYRIRWFTPVAEVNLCGHATLATAFVIFHTVTTYSDIVEFESKSGLLKVERDENKLTLDFPATSLQMCDIPNRLPEALGKVPNEILRCKTRYFAVYKDRQDIEALTPDFKLLEKIDIGAVIVTAPDEEVDFVSRFFAPRYGINEDPVTGSAHCELTPYWAERLGKSKLKARQLSKRGGALECELVGDRVRISGSAVKYLEGKIRI